MHVNEMDFKNKHIGVRVDENNPEQRLYEILGIVRPTWKKQDILIKVHVV